MKSVTKFDAAFGGRRKDVVEVPEQFKEVFRKAQELVEKYFSHTRHEPDKGTFSVSDERYIMVRTASMSVEFFDMVRQTLGENKDIESDEVAKDMLFDLAHAQGRADARAFFKKMGLKEPVSKLSAGPIIFAYSGWARVRILPESRPSPDDDYFLAFEHPYSFEADAWMNTGKKVDFPVCIMNSGYSSGWCQESFGIPLVTVELECRAKGDDRCFFVMAPPSKIKEHLERYGLCSRSSFEARGVRIPGFFGRQKLEKELRESEERFRAIFDNALDGLLVIDPESLKFEMASPRFCDMIKCDPDEIPLLTVEDIHRPEDMDMVRENIRKQFSGEMKIAKEVPVLRSDGTVFYADINATMFKYGGKVRLLGVFHDITERREAEQRLLKSKEELEKANMQLKLNQQQLLQSEKMASLGQLAAGVAHEINNPIGFVASNLSTLKEYFLQLRELISLYKELESPGDESSRQVLLQKIARLKEEMDLDYIMNDTADLIEESKEGAERVRDIVLNLKSFARVDEAKVQEIDINQAIESTLKIAWNELKYKCKVKKDLKPLPKVKCYPGQLNQVFLNLLVNAAQAIENKGVVEVSTRLDKDHVVITVSDTGSGIPPEVKERIFEPFFTTKEPGKGTGLGLSIVYSIIQKHNGAIDVDSEPGKGTKFTIRLPIHGVGNAEED